MLKQHPDRLPRGRIFPVRAKRPAMPGRPRNAARFPARWGSTVPQGPVMQAPRKAGSRSAGPGQWSGPDGTGRAWKTFLFSGRRSMRLARRSTRFMRASGV